jgi:hypothetical protein
MDEALSSPLLQRLIFAPFLFWFYAKIVQFFMKKLKVPNNMDYIMIAMTSVPVMLFILIGSNSTQEAMQDPPSKITTFVQMMLMIMYYVGLDIGVFMLIYVKSVKDNWPLFKCSPIYMMTASFFGFDTETNFEQCIQTMQSGYMTVLMEPINYLMSATTSTVGGLTSSLNDLRDFMNNFRNNLTSSIQNIFGVFLNMLTQIQIMVIKIKDMMSKNVGIMTTMMYTLDTSVQTMENTWAGPIGKTVRAL